MFRESIATAAILTHIYCYQLRFIDHLPTDLYITFHLRPNSDPILVICPVHQNCFLTRAQAGDQLRCIREGQGRDETKKNAKGVRC